ncbi:hypothetical protein DFH06DRAFT_1337297 [Mycena polygramma]|nr:hypothetical protein DFH06DRAFT_1337297 [Mycena polygramma]
MASPFIPQLGTNFCPTDDEVLQIKALLVEPSLRLNQLDDEIGKLQQAIDKLADERNGLGAFVEAHKALISPFRRLPLDMIQEIFVACLPTDHNCVMNVSEVPLLLGRICSSWRAISLSTPRLWARLHIVRPPSPPPNPDHHELQYALKCARHLETMKAWLSRSGDCPLAISLDDIIDDDPISRSGAIPYIRVLISLASRWQEIKFTGQAPVLVEALSSLTASDVPILEGISIKEHPSVWSSQNWASVGILGGLQLSKLSLSVGNIRPTGLLVRWSQLTSLSMDDLLLSDPLPTLTTDSAIQILSQCHALRFCRLTVNDPIEWDSHDRAVGSIVKCPSLNEMTLSCNTVPASTVLQRILQRLSLPVLRRISLRGYSDPRSPSILSCPSLLTFAPRLEVLDISTDTFSKAFLADLLRGLPTIQRLEIRDSWAVEPPLIYILELLAPSRDLTSPCCPALRELRLQQCSLASDEPLLDFITAKMTAGSCSPLRRVEASFPRARQVDILPNLRQFSDDGFHISLQYLPPRRSEFFPWRGLNPNSEGYPQPNMLPVEYGF